MELNDLYWSNELVDIEGPRAHHAANTDAETSGKDVPTWAVSGADATLTGGTEARFRRFVADD